MPTTRSRLFLLLRAALISTGAMLVTATVALADGGGSVFPHIVIPM